MIYNQIQDISLWANSTLNNILVIGNNLYSSITCSLQTNDYSLITDVPDMVFFPQTNQETTAKCPPPPTTPTTQQATTNGLSTLRESFTKYNVSPEITTIFMASRRDSTKKQYKVHLEKWLAFCRQRCISYSSPKVNDALDFLMVLYNKGLTYSTINTARSALSSVITLESGENFGSHPLVVRFFEGIYEPRKPQPKYNSIHVYTPDPALCPLLTLKEYILRTAPCGRARHNYF